MEEEWRRIREEESGRRREEAEERRRVSEEEAARRREDEAARRLEEEERRRTCKLEDDITREKRELLQDKLKGLGMYKEWNELGAYLDKYERIMRESGVSEKDWGERLYARLPERVCMRVAQARDDKCGVFPGLRGVVRMVAHLVTAYFSCCHQNNQY